MNPLGGKINCSEMSMKENYNEYAVGFNSENITFS